MAVGILETWTCGNNRICGGNISHCDEESMVDKGLFLRQGNKAVGLLVEMLMSELLRDLSLGATEL